LVLTRRYLDEADARAKLSLAELLRIHETVTAFGFNAAELPVQERPTKRQKL
jgi:hypothetical protein